MRNPSQSALGAWSGGRFIHFGEEIEEQRLVELLRPGGGIDTLITADAYGAGGADLIVGQSLSGAAREDYCLVGAVGHDFYEGERRGAKGFQRFTDAELRGPDQYASYLRMAIERSLERRGRRPLPPQLLLCLSLTHRRERTMRRERLVGCEQSAPRRAAYPFRQ